LLPSRVLHKQATTPPLPFISIASSHLPWSTLNGSYVSVGDVCSSIYQSLRTNITTSEFNCFPHQRDQVRATLRTDITTSPFQKDQVRVIRAHEKRFHAEIIVPSFFRLLFDTWTFLGFFFRLVQRPWQFLLLDNVHFIQDQKL